MGAGGRRRAGTSAAARVTPRSRPTHANGSGFTARRARRDDTHRAVVAHFGPSFRDGSADRASRGAEVRALDVRELALQVTVHDHVVRRQPFAQRDHHT